MGMQFVGLPNLSGLADKSRRNIRYASAAFAFETIEKALMGANRSK